MPCSRRFILKSTAACVVASAIPGFANKANAAPDLARLDALAQAELVRKREVSALELVDAAIHRIDQVNPKLNAMVTAMFDRARKAARKPLPNGPFAGVPSLAKDVNDYKGVRTTFGSRLFADNISTKTEPLLAAYDRAGIIFVGKSNTPEYGFLPTTEPLLLGPCRNPWNTEHSTGGSSGGAAAAVAAGMVPFAHANDIGGSIRIPASCCGVFGLKPSFGRIDLGYADVSGVMVADHMETRSVRDSAMALSITEATGRKAAFAPIGYVSGPGGKKLKIALTMDNALGAAPAADVKAAIERSAKLCADLGHEVIPAAHPLAGDHQIIEAYIALFATDAAALVKLARKRGFDPSSVLEPWTLGNAAVFEKLPKDAVQKALAYRLEIVRRLDAFFAKYDAWLTPVVDRAPPKLGELAPTIPYATLRERSLAYASYTALHNFAGTPAMSVPLFWNDAGLPIGSQFSAARGGEKTLLELAYQLEAAQPWAAKYPPVFAG
ncbi:Putative amidase AmiC [Rhodopseudomonas palustris]|uniref:Indoleacetamide hydrolase n=1 Tax=Rhodopseudomonas palustris (strain ATCC BAA-98 / CGA009) TaxID=258594 RepID=Q6N2T9_RHOPA|nr:amidase [Rhodopseudomonas palustris]OPF92778.1 amidase [Rhodopseudomonas palustris]QQM05518.1 Putative amidase AmiC [Rhodopseudomonas palustris]RJF63364.1 amidase [Rhodopseudomonas palustris]WAB76851.1 amidase [Rhodopseudomonas palustris]WCL94142.1 amidase [Rhodopseudomonas palustris CGA009]